MLTPEERIPIQQVPAIVGRSLQSIYRWFRVGVNGVRLRTEKIGGYRFTSRQWIEEFVESQNQKDVALTGGEVNAR